MNKRKVTEIDIQTANPLTDQVVGIWTDANGIKRVKNFKFQPGSQIIGKLIGVNMNSTLDQLISLFGGSNFIITDVVITNASVSLDTANNLGLWSAPNKSGNSLTHSPIGLSGLTTSLKFIAASRNNFSLYGGDVFSNNIYLSLVTPQGVAATADIYVYGYTL